MGMVLLIGIVAISSATILVIGGGAMSGVEKEVTDEQRESEMQQVAHELQNARLGETQRSVDVSDDYSVEDGGTLTVLVDGEERARYDLGRLENEELAYEGGLVINEETVVNSPEINSGENSSQIVLPVLRGKSFSGKMEVTETNVISVEDPTANVTIRIESENADVWADHFAESDADVTSSGDVVEIEFEGGSVPEPETIEHSIIVGGEGSNGIGLNDIPTLEIDSYRSTAQEFERGNAEFAINDSIDENQGGGSEDNWIDGDLVATGEVDEQKWNVTGNISEDVELDGDGVPTDEILEDPSGTQYTGGNMNGRTYYANDLTIDSQVDVTDDSVLIVGGDLTVDDTQIRVLHDSNLEIHVHGNLYFEGASEIITDPTSHNARAVSIFVGGDEIRVKEGGGSTKVTGFVHATDAELAVGGDFEVHGALAVNELSTIQNTEQDKLLLHYDENLEGAVIHESRERIKFESAFRDSIHLNIVIPEIAVE